MTTAPAPRRRRSQSRRGLESVAWLPVRLKLSNSGSTPRELPFEGGDPIAKRSVLGFLVAQSLGEVEGNGHE